MNEDLALGKKKGEGTREHPALPLWHKSGQRYSPAGFQGSFTGPRTIQLGPAGLVMSS